MDGTKIPYLCGGVFFFLLTVAAQKNGTARDHQAGKKDNHSDPVLMKDLINTITGKDWYESKKDTSKFKDCQIEGSCNIPFDDVVFCTEYENLVTSDYGAALDRMNCYVKQHLNPEMKEMLVKAILEVIEKDMDINEEDVFYILPDGRTVSKADIRVMTFFPLPAFLVGVLNYILTERREKNIYGVATLDFIGEKKNRKPRKYKGYLGKTIMREVSVDFQCEIEANNSNAYDQQHGVSAEDVAFPAQNSVIAEEIQCNNQQEDDSYTGRNNKTEDKSDFDNDKTTIIHQQTNVIQNGNNNINLTNNGTINFNF